MFLRHVVHVVLKRAEEKMVRSNTFTVVAPVENEKVTRDCAVIDAPRNSVRSFFSALFLSSPQKAIAAIVKLTHPFPAITVRALSRCLVYLAEKAFFNGYRLATPAARAVLCYVLVSHNVSLLSRFTEWLGSACGCNPLVEPFCILPRINILATAKYSYMSG